MRKNGSRPRHIGALVVLTTVAAVSLSACSGGGNSADNSSPPSSSSSVDASLKVPAPLPTQEFLSNPCSALTDAELDGVGLKPPGKVSQGPPDLCRWESAGTRMNSVAVGAVPQNKGGISDIYDQKATQAYFEPFSASGYPGVVAAADDLRSHGTCSVWVGITDQLAFTVVTSITTGANKATPCKSAQKVSEAVVTHLKGAA
ncbi:DUF3558 domain-containing protein [Amycolatopsis jiangsuensis]|uniref:DUF3558 domain-containing protein n=1 Tax=Amycolatopsis jiangsuensis TaxID=1181879 RepID=A0A840J4S9_9PSEU|nr:DUF3558 domain-containing protein [Amycolatopsis jiangsuensis]MBB4688625.1 hypothetical protein [Amycolatopsis jiangsuensis]